MREPECWRIRWNPNALPIREGLASDLAQAIAAVGREERPTGLHPDLSGLAGVAPATVTFFDLETLGLGNAAVFLVGFMVLAGGELVVEQLLAENYSEEPAIISAFARRMASSAALVSYNGKSYDMPLLEGRAGMWQVKLPRGRMHHLDLLYEARRRWSRTLPDCRLVTVERFICGRRREGDIPGAEIPAVYHRYVEDGDARPMGPVLWHNALDLVTLGEVLLECLG
jgi:uncharacterized protein YprB with RNaseH-like and TPR domain